jgi:glycine cleavage system H protein
LASPSELQYTNTHEWVRDNGDGTVTVGITQHAQDALGELVYAELPAIGRQVTQGEACAVVESTKAASDVYAPVSGEILAQNSLLATAPEIVNQAPYTDGWLFQIRLSDPAQLSALATADTYDRGPDA